jgi:hypothetical protein
LGHEFCEGFEAFVRSQNDAEGYGLGNVTEVVSSRFEEGTFVQNVDSSLNRGFSAWARDEVGFEVEAVVEFPIESVSEDGLDDSGVDVSRSLETTVELI